MLLQTQQPHHDDAIVKKVSNASSKSILQLPVMIEGSEGSDCLAHFDRNEISVGSLVGSGSFSQVFEITSFEAKNNTKKLRKSNISSSTTATETSRRRKRLDLIEEHEKNVENMCSGEVRTNRFVIKQLHQRLVDDPKLFRRALKDLCTEVSIMSSLEHPHIAQLHATALGGAGAMNKSGSKHDSYFLVLDRLVQTLDDRIECWNQTKVRTGPSYYLDYSVDNQMALKANYALQIGSALQYLHSRKIIFRDLKPQNIGFKEVHPDHPERDVLALFDFGLSRKLPSPEKANSDGLYRMSMVGTRRYMAPEVVVSRWYDDRADTYSWSLVFYELVTQTRPFDGIQRAEHKQYICIEGKRPKIYSYFGFSPELEELMRLAWAQDVKKRLTMNEVCEALKTYLAGTIHEDCVRHPLEGNNKPEVIQDDSISSFLTYSSQHTEQTISTVNSFTMDDDTGNKHQRSRHEPSETNVAVPQAIAVVDTTEASSPSRLPDDHEDDYLRRVSLCERCMESFRDKLRMFRGL